jgi:hypothetical protein
MVWKEAPESAIQSVPTGGDDLKALSHCRGSRDPFGRHRLSGWNPALGSGANEHGRQHTGRSKKRCSRAGNSMRSSQARQGENSAGWGPRGHGHADGQPRSSDAVGRRGASDRKKTPRSGYTATHRRSSGGGASWTQRRWSNNAHGRSRRGFHAHGVPSDVCGRRCEENHREERGPYACDLGRG